MISLLILKPNILLIVSLPKQPSPIPIWQSLSSETLDRDGSGGERGHLVLKTRLGILDQYYSPTDLSIKPWDSSDKVLNNNVTMI